MFALFPPPRRVLRWSAAPLFAAVLTHAGAALGQEAQAWLVRAGAAAKSLNYVGTVVYQHAGRVETSRLVHMSENGQEFEKLVSLDGPPVEVIRHQGEVRCYYPDAKVVRVEPRTFRNAFPALSAEQQQTLIKYYDFRRLPAERVAGQMADVVTFEPRDGLRYGHKFWSDAATGLLLKARIVNDRGEPTEQFAFTEVSTVTKVDRDMVKPSWPNAPAEWQVRDEASVDVVKHETGWSASRLPQGFEKIVEGYRTLRGKRYPVAHLVYSDGLVAVSVFIEPVAPIPLSTGASQHGGFNVYTLRQDDYLVTALGEVPPAAVRLIALSVGRRPAPDSARPVQ